ncbi:MAG: hypothetical protein RIT52_2185 [Pseudomonadota bacterium]|jgi:hypothetical protein
MKRLILARLLPALLIAGCVGGSATRDVLQGAMTISGPSGYCVDPSASREGDDRAIILMGRCSASTAVKPAVVTLSVGPAGSAGVMIAGGAELTKFFTSTQGRKTLAASGRARDVEVLEALSVGDAFLMRLQETDQPSYWRAVMGLRGRLVTISVQGSLAEPLAVEDGRVLIDKSIATMQRANGS